VAGSFRDQAEIGFRYSQAHGIYSRQGYVALKLKLNHQIKLIYIF